MYTWGDINDFDKLKSLPTPNWHHHLAAGRRGLGVGASQAVADVSPVKNELFSWGIPRGRKVIFAVPYLNLAFKQNAFSPIFTWGSNVLGHYWHFIYTFSLCSGSARTWDFSHANAVSYFYQVQGTCPSLWTGPLSILIQCTLNFAPFGKSLEYFLSNKLIFWSSVSGKL